MQKLIYTFITLLFLVFTACQQSAPAKAAEEQKSGTENTESHENHSTEASSATESKTEKAVTAKPVLLAGNDGKIRLDADQNSDDYRIIAYSKPDKTSQKLVLLSVFTEDVENNPQGCELGAYYDLDGMADNGVEFGKYLATEGDFVKVELMAKGGKKEAYIVKEWVAVKE